MFHNPSEQDIQLMFEIYGNGLVSALLVDSDGEVGGHQDNVHVAGYGRPIRDQSLVLPLDIESEGSVQLFIGSYALEGTDWCYDYGKFRTLEQIGKSHGGRWSVLWPGKHLITFLSGGFREYSRARLPLFLRFFWQYCIIVFIASGLYQHYLPSSLTVYGGYYLFIASGAMDFTASVFSILLLRLHLTKSRLFKGWLFLIK